MKTDAALLQWCAAGPDRAVFRAYGWARATLSLGRAEPFPEGWDVDALRAAGIEVVRRPTGGDAVLHDEEIAFAAAVTLPGPWGLTPRGFTELIAESVTAAMRELGLDASRVTRPEGEVLASAMAPGSRPCFARSEPGEVRAGGFKVAGIAARFTRGAALSHASIPLSPRHRDVAAYRVDGFRWTGVLEDHARSAAELLGEAVSPERVEREIAEALGARLSAGVGGSSFEAIGLEDPIHSTAAPAPAAAPAALRP